MVIARSSASSKNSYGINEHQKHGIYIHIDDLSNACRVIFTVITSITAPIQS
ncbi:hypothetical protein Hanom_Chr05g00427611 [Helianthus anomalus]